jgi:hypothetical protein
MPSSKRRLTALIGTASLIPVLALSAHAGASAAASSPARVATLASLHSDFDGDGLDDVFAFRYVSADHPCRYLSYSTGISPACPAPLPDYQGDPQMLATTSADFDGDGYDDLALGEPDWGPSRGLYNVGRVQVYYGSADGLEGGKRYQGFNHRTPGIEGIDPRAHGFGHAVAAGDVNGDGFADLVIGVPGDSAAGVPAAGSVVVLYGSASGLQTVGSVRFGQAHVGVPGVPSQYGEFGSAVAAVDVTGDGFADVAVSDEGRRSDFVSSLRGSSSGVSFVGASHVDTVDLRASEVDLMTAGDVNGDGYADLIGASPRYIPGGVILQMLGGPDGIADVRSKRFTEDSPGVPRAALPSDFWGSAIAVGDVNGDGRDDLLASSPAKTVAGVKQAGIVIMLPGSPSGLTGRGSTFWSENTPGFCDVAEEDDWFGNAISVGHFADAARDDAIISAPMDSEGTSFDYSGLLTWVTGGTVPTPGQCVEGSDDEWLGFVMIGPRQNA